MEAACSSEELISTHILHGVTAPKYHNMHSHRHEDGQLGSEAVLSDKTSFNREDDGNWFLRNLSKFLPGYTAPHPTRQSFSQLLPSELRISYNQHCISVHL